MRRLLLIGAAGCGLAVAACSDVSLVPNASASERIHLVNAATGEARASVGVERNRALDAKSDDVVRISGGDVNSTLNASGDARINAGDVAVTGSVAGRLEVNAADFAARDLVVGSADISAADIAFAGESRGDVRLRGADVRWSGPAGGAFSVQAADFVFRGSVAGALTVQSADAVIDGPVGALELQAADAALHGGFRSAGDVRASVADFVLQGAVDGGLDLAANSVRIAGRVTGPLAIYADPGRRPHGRDDGLVVISGDVSGGFICARHVVIERAPAGALRVMADAAPELLGPAQGADIDFIAREGRRCERGMEG